MSSLEKNISALETKLRESRDSSPNSDRVERDRFLTIRAYYRLICSISLKNIKDNSRNSMKSFLERGMEIENIYASRHDCSYSLKEDLLFFVNKLSNSQVWDYISETLSKDREQSFILIHEFVKHPSSFALRERLCREEWLIPKCILLQERRRELSIPEIYRWNLLLKQISKHCPYFLADVNKFHSLFADFEKIGHETATKDELMYNDFRENSMEILKHFIMVNGKDIYVRNIYIANFLNERCYNLSRRMEPLLTALETENDLRYFFKNMSEEIGYLFNRNIGERSNPKAPSITNFLLSKLSIALLDKIEEKGLGTELMTVLVRAIERYNASTRSEDLVSFLNLALGVLVRFPITSQSNPYKDFREKFLKFSWNNIVYPKDSNKVLKNISKLIISTMIQKYDVFREVNQREKNSQLYEFILSEHEDIHDEDSGNIWLECLKNLIPACQESGHDWLKSFMYLHDFPKDMFSPTNQISIHNRFWQIITLLRNSFKDKFLSIVEGKFFKEMNLSNHNSFDIILQIIVRFVQEREILKDSSVFDLQHRSFLFERLIMILKSEQETSKNYIDKFYHITIIFMKIFDDVSLSTAGFEELLRPLKVDEVQREATLSITRTLRTQKYFMSLLTYLIQRAEPSQKSILSSKATRYIINSKIIQSHNAFLVHSQLFPVFYNLLKDCVKNSDHFTELLITANNLLKEMIEKKVNIGIFFSLMIYHFIFEKAVEITEFKIINIESFIILFLNYLIRKKNKEKIQSLDFNELFEIPAHGPPKDYNVLRYYKFFVILMLKILVVQYKNHQKESDFAVIQKVYDTIFKKLTNPDYDIKFQALRILECLISPSEVTDPDLQIFKVQNLDRTLQFKLIQSATMESNICLKESNNPQFQQIFTKFYEIVINYFRRNPMDENSNDFWKNTISNNFALLDKRIREKFIEKVEQMHGTSLIQRITFFFKNYDSLSKNAKNLSLENYELFANIAIHCCRLLEEQSARGTITLKMNGQLIPDCNALFSAFIALQEIEGSDSTFSIFIAKTMIKSEYSAMSKTQQHEFVINVLDLLANQKSISNIDVITFLEILLDLNRDFANSELFYALVKKNNKILRFLEQAPYQKSYGHFRNQEPQQGSATVEDMESQILMQTTFYDQLAERYSIPDKDGAFKMSPGLKGQIYLQNQLFDEALKEISDALLNLSIQGNNSVNGNSQLASRGYHADHSSHTNDYLDLCRELTERKLVDQWTETKKCLNQWSDLQQISEKTER